MPSTYTNDQFDSAIEELVEQMSAGEILSVPGVYELLAEHLNNDALALLAEREADVIDEVYDTTRDELDMAAFANGLLRGPR